MLKVALDILKVLMKSVHVTISPLLAPLPHPHTPPYRSSSHCFAKKYIKTCSGIMLPLCDKFPFGVFLHELQLLGDKLDHPEEQNPEFNCTMAASIDNKSSNTCNSLSMFINTVKADVNVLLKKSYVIGSLQVREGHILTDETHQEVSVIVIVSKSLCLYLSRLKCNPRVIKVKWGQQHFQVFLERCGLSRIEFEVLLFKMIMYWCGCSHSLSTV